MGGMKVFEVLFRLSVEELFFNIKNFIVENSYQWQEVYSEHINHLKHIDVDKSQVCNCETYVGRIWELPQAGKGYEWLFVFDCRKSLIIQKHRYTTL